MKRNKKRPKQPIIGIKLDNLFKKNESEDEEGHSSSFFPSFLIRSLNKGSKINAK